MAWPSTSRRNVITAAGIAGGAALLEYLRRQGEPPPAEWVHDSLWGDDLLAYAVWNGQPRAVLIMDGDRIQYDLMTPRPQWQLAGMGYSIGVADAPAIAGYAPCVGISGERCAQSPDLFGQITDPDIVALEVRIGDAWRRFPVHAPGFVIRLDGATGPPTGYRWLDSSDHIVWETASHVPTKPGSSRPYHPRRRNATPVHGERHLETQ
jgi:hypothetical protein